VLLPAHPSAHDADVAAAILPAATNAFSGAVALSGSEGYPRRVPDTRTHRGLAPQDERLFEAQWLDILREATSDLGWLLTKGYAARSAVELVGNRYGLEARQRLAVARCACSKHNVLGRMSRRIDPATLAGQELWLDGLNILTTLEVALSGGIVLVGQDGCCRDVAGLHRHYRKVDETLPALRLVGAWTGHWRVGKCRWWLDQPVSNSGRLKRLILDTSAEAGWPWEAELVYSPDSVLKQTAHPVASSDSVILDRCQRWINLDRLIITQELLPAKLVDLSMPSAAEQVASPTDLGNSVPDERRERELH